MSTAAQSRDHRSVSAGDVKEPDLIHRYAGVPPRCPLPGGNRMLEMTNENFARLLRGLTFAVGKRTNRILLYQFLAAEIRLFIRDRRRRVLQKSPNVPGKL